MPTRDRRRAILDGALALWRGPAYGEFGNGFAHVAAVRLDELRMAALEDRVELLLRAGAATEAVAQARDLVAAEPLRERRIALLMRALHADGRVADALDAYRRPPQADGRGARPRSVGELARAGSPHPRR